MHNWNYMSKFNVGDRVRDTDSSNEGTVIKFSFNSITQEDEYVVKWDAFYSESTHSMSEADFIWEKIEGKGTNDPKVCSHIYKVYKGFTEEYEFCVKCDSKKELI